MSEKLQKVLARAGVGSRRQMEVWIQEGRISVNGKVASLGDRVEEQDTIRVNGRIIKQSKLKPDIPRVLAYYKPEGEICTEKDPEGRPTVFQKLPRLDKGRWVMVGRLDLNTSGLLLFTNNGELANKLMHPSSRIDREYAARILGDVDAEMIAKLKQGVVLEDGIAKFTDVQKFETKEQMYEETTSANQWYHVVLMEGRNREVRRLWESQGVRVSRLMRVRYGPVFLDQSRGKGDLRELSLGELNKLLSWVDMPTVGKIEYNGLPKLAIARYKPKGQRRKKQVK